MPPDRRYVEFSSLLDGVQCTWQRRADAGDRPLIIPDGCVDLVWFSDGRVEVAGPDTTARRVRFDAHVEIVGVRFAAAAARRVSDIPISELCNQQPDLAALGATWKRAAYRLAETSDAAMPVRRKALLALAARGVKRPDDGLVTAAVRRLTRFPNTRVGVLASELGVSVRQLHRRFLDEVGYGPKTLGRIARLHRLLDAAATSPDLASLALTAGFASQAHMSDEVRALTSLTPGRFLEDRRGR